MRDSLTVLGLLSYLFYINWRLTLVVVVILPIIGFLVSKINRRLRRLNRQHQDMTNALSYIVEEAVNGYKVIKIYNGERYELSRFEAMTARLRGYSMRMVVTGGLAQPLTQWLASMALAIVISIAIVQTSHDQTTIGGFVSFVTAMLLVVSPLKHLMDVNQPLQRGMTAAELIFELMDEPIEDQHLYTNTNTEQSFSSHKETSQATEVASARVRGSIQFDNVTFRYGERQQAALNNICFSIEPGETVALVGASGSGKSPLINLIPRFFDPQSGCIFIDGKPIQDYGLALLRQQLAFVSQDIILFNDTVAMNVAYGQSPVHEQAVDRALSAAYLQNTIAHLPEGKNTLIGDNGLRLSGGQRQRLAIARAIYKDAPILILDEATSSLDSESERHVQAALEQLMADRTTLVIAHRLSTIEKADRIFVLDHGNIVEIGTHAELLQKNGMYAQLYRTQFSIRQDT